jgi:hypothetical protein
MTARPGTEFRGEEVGRPRIAVNQGCFDGFFAAAVIVDISGIEILEAPFQEEINHPFGFFDINGLAIAELGKTHQTKAKFLDICIHKESLL